MLVVLLLELQQGPAVRQRWLLLLLLLRAAEAAAVCAVKAVARGIIGADTRYDMLI